MYSMTLSCVQCCVVFFRAFSVPGQKIFTRTCIYEITVQGSSCSKIFPESLSKYMSSLNFFLGNFVFKCFIFSMRENQKFQKKITLFQEALRNLYDQYCPRAVSCTRGYTQIDSFDITVQCSLSNDYTL